jgi:hypothetical protein
MPCGMQVENSMPWHAGKTACNDAHRFGICAAGQAPSLPGSRQISALRAVHVRAHSTACCMFIAHDMKNGPCIIGMHPGMRRGSQPRVPENAGIGGSLERGAESPDACQDACKRMHVHSSTCYSCYPRSWHARAQVACATGENMFL